MTQIESGEGQSPKYSLQIHGSDVYLQNPVEGNLPNCSFLGPEGTYCEEAAKGLLESQVDYTPVGRITEIIRGLELSRFNIGVVPIENSSEGNVIETVRGIIRSDLNILGEEIIPIKHVLFGSKIAINKKQVLRSHPQAIGQCAIWLEKNLPGITVITHESTAEAIRVATERDDLAIGNINAAKLFNIQVLEHDVQDYEGNTTRFWLLGKGETEPTGNDRTTLLFSLKNRVGLLREALSVFADRTINITKIDSFPIGVLDEYYFLLSIDGHRKDDEIYKALKQFEDVCLKVRVIGSYHKGDIPDRHFEPNAVLNGWVEF